jgi:kynureninase
LTANQKTAGIPYADNDNRFLGATYEPTSHFRAARVVEFFEQQNLTPDLLHRNYREQVAYLRKRFLNLDFNPAVIRLKHEYPCEYNGGFVALESSRAGDLNRMLKERNVFTDFRNTTLRMGPAPYVNSMQIDYALDTLAESVRNL